VVIRNGTLTVRGAIEGDVLVLNGDAIVETGGVVTGSVTAVNGKVHRAGGTISGAVEEKEGIDVEYTYPQDRRIKNVRYRLTNYMQEDLSVRDLHLHNFTWDLTASKVSRLESDPGRIFSGTARWLYRSTVRLDMHLKLIAGAQCSAGRGSSRFLTISLWRSVPRYLP
jgi:hypothetical protein